MCADVPIDMRTDAYMDTCIDLCVDVCIDMCMDMCVDMRGDAIVDEDVDAAGSSKLVPTSQWPPVWTCQCTRPYMSVHTSIGIST